MRSSANALTRPAAAWLLGLGLALAPAVAEQDLQVDLELSPRSIALDELAILSIRVDGAGNRRVRPEADFELENFRIATGPTTANSLVFHDGTSSRVLTLTWRLQPLAVGTARVHSGRLHLGTRAIPLPEDRLAVVAPAPAEQRESRRDPRAPQDVFPGDSFDSGFTPPRRRRLRPVAPPRIYLSAEVDPAEPYVGEQVLYTLYLFIQTDVHSVYPEELPAFRGFWSRVVPQPDQLRPKMIFRDGERIGRVVLLQRALFARRAGRIEIEPAKARLAAMMPDPGPGGSPLPRSREILRSSDTVTVDVRELPPPPAGFQGAVGQITISAELDPRSLEVGDAATLSLTLAGHGHFQGLPPPLLGELDGIRVFPPQQQSSESVERKQVSGERSWSFVLVPERPGKWQLPPIEVPYFDPAQERYRTASATLLELAVKRSTRLAQRNDRTVELHPIRTAALPAPGAGGWSGAGPWLFVLPWILTAALFLARRRGPLLGQAQRHRLQRQRLLERLRDAAASSRPRQAAAEIEEAWRDFLHDRWQLPPGSPSTRWGSLLAARGARRSAADELVTLAEDLHYLRYAPKLSSTEELQRELVERSRKLARAVG